MKNPVFIYIGFFNWRFHFEFELLDLVSNVKNQTRARRARTPANIVSVAHSVAENPCLSIPRRSLELGISQTTLHWILYKDLCIKAYKIQLKQKLKPADHEQRRVFANWVLEMHENEPDFHRKIIMSDEVHFHLRDNVNQQNCRICGSEIPKMIIGKSLYPQSETVRCGFWAGGIIGSFFFKMKPRSRDLTPLDFFLWSCVKDKVYADASQSIQELKEKIRAIIDEIEPQMCENVIKLHQKTMVLQT